jgi:hypothetical protein
MGPAAAALSSLQNKGESLCFLSSQGNPLILLSSMSCTLARKTVGVFGVWESYKINIF